jgi:hypothetical protein
MKEDWQVNNLDEFVTRYKERARQGYADWESLDGVLLDTCQRFPHHQKKGEILAKVALINRVYGTQLEKANGRAEGGNAEYAIAGQMVGKVDVLIEELRVLNGFCADAVPKVLDVHHRLLQITHEATKRWEVSFCSKYLSFHAPKVVPIFDKKASGVSQKLVPLGKNFMYDITRRNVSYARHCYAILGLVNKLQDSGETEPNLKLIDFVLYRSGGGNL